MKRIPYLDESAKKTVKRFCDQVGWLRNVRRIYEELFEKEDSSGLIERTASSFFADLNTILQYYLLLEFVKVTDPPATGKNENLTVDNLIESIDWPQHILQKLSLLRQKTTSFRGYVLDARNKLLAHIDKEAFLAEKTLGGFPEGEDEVYLKTLEEIADIAHETCFGGIIGQRVLAAPGDVINPKKTLANSIAFDRLLAESNGKEKMRLFSYLPSRKGKS